MENNFKAYIVLWAIHAIDMGNEFDLDDGMWKLYYSLPEEEIQNIIETLQREGLVLIRSTKAGNRIYPTLVLSDEGKSFLEHEAIKNSSVQEFDIGILDAALGSIIGFLNVWHRLSEGNLNFFDLISDLNTDSQKGECIVRYLNMHGDIYRLCNDRHYLNEFCSQNIGYLRDFLGELPELEAAIFRYNYKIYDLFYKDISDIMEYYGLDDKEIMMYKENTLYRYHSSKWYNNCMWVRQMMDCFFGPTSTHRLENII